VPNSGYAGYANHPWHHYMAVGPASLLELVLPFLVIAVFALLMTAGSWAANQAKALFMKRKAHAASPPALTSEADSGSPVLASDRERDEALNLVSQGIGEGRLSIEEGMQRIDAVFHSRHRHEIGSLVADLPTSPPSATRSLTFAQLRRGPLVVAAAAIFAAVMVQALVGLWELWPLALVALGWSALLPRRSTRELNPA
jgi:hypothetical protein